MNSSKSTGALTAPPASLRNNRIISLACTFAVVASTFGAMPALASDKGSTAASTAAPAPETQSSAPADAATGSAADSTEHAQTAVDTRNTDSDKADSEKPGAEAGATDGSKPSSLLEAIGERGSFMGQSIAAKHQGVKVQEAKPADLMEARALEPMAGSWKAPGINGLDVSGWQPDVNWAEQWNMGARFAYVKATEGSYYTSETFNEQYRGSYNVGMIRGAYHFALPQVGNARAQARFFVNNGGGWSADGHTLPPLLDIEHNPYPDWLGNICYDMNASQMVDWVQNFSSQVRRMTGRKPMIYTTYAWWTECTNNSDALDKHDLHVAAYPYPGYEDGFDIWMFGGWDEYTMWQYSATGPFAGDSNHFNGSYKDLKAFATNGFADVTTSTKFYTEIMWADRQNITNGWPDSTFRPHLPINRDAMAAFLYRMAGRPAFDPPRTSPFRDYGPGDKFYKEVAWLEAAGITNGWKVGKNAYEYRPLEPINRDAMAAFLYRFAGKPSYDPPRNSPFRDYPRGSKFYKEITWLESTNITNGWEVSDDVYEYRPLEPINRDAMAAFLYRYARTF
ncbi:MAG TPA: GH25 family lysozyme [Arthrobacter sp.]|nr:GH25 family lysozyme [Arthrobacter sp.]